LLAESDEISNDQGDEDEQDDKTGKAISKAVTDDIDR
jgi:hypothetical protein